MLRIKILLISLGFLIVCRANAQFTVCNNGLTTVSIVPGFTVSINGGYTSQTLTGINGIMDNQGTLQLTGDWNNSNTAALPNPFSTSAGIVIFNGTALQNLRGANATIFHDLVINNTGGAAAGVSLSGAVNSTADNSLTLTDGVVTTGSNIFILSNTAAGNLSYTNGFLYGTFRRYLASNTDTYLFPLGDGTSSANRHRLSFINNAIAGVTYLDASVASFVQAAPNNDAALNTMQGGAPITETAGEAAGKTVLWTLTPDAVPSGGDYGVQLFAENTNLAASDDNMFCPIKRNGAASYADFLTIDPSTSIPPSGDAGRIYNAGNGYAERKGYTSFSQYAIGKSIMPLPIKLLCFDAYPNENIVDIKWTTASESNNDYFVVQHSTDGSIFTDVIQVTGAGNSTTMTNYAAIDCEPYSGISYYRLKQVDYNCNFSYSSTVTVNFKTQDEISICPNPTNGVIYILCKGDINQVCSINVFTASGTKIYHADGYQQTIDLSTQPDGFYLVDFNVNSKIISKKVVLKK